MTRHPVTPIPIFDLNELIINEFSLFGCVQAIKRVLCFLTVWRERNSSSFQDTSYLMIALISTQFCTDCNRSSIHRR